MIKKSFALLILSSLLFANLIFSQDQGITQKDFERIDNNLHNKPLISLSIANSLLQNTTQISDKAKLLKKIATAHYFLSDYDDALIFYQKTFNEYTKIDDKDGLSSCYNNIGLIYKKKGSRNKAFEYLVKSLDIEQKRGNEKEITFEFNFNNGGNK